MDIKKADDWPQTPDGATDWETVFENETDGFIPLIEMASTPFVMKDCAVVIIQQLFSRDDDAMNIMKFVIALNDIIPDEKELSKDKDALAAMRSEISELLRKIKKDRLRKAADFLRRKTQEEKERRAKP